MKRSSKPQEVTTTALQFHDVGAGPAETPSWLGESAAAKGTTIASLYPKNIAGGEEDDAPEPGSERARSPTVLPRGIKMTSAPAANDTHPPRHPEPGAVTPSAVRLSDIPKAPKALDTLIDELIPRADEEAAEAMALAVADLAIERLKMLSDAEDDLFQLVRLVCERVLAREMRTDPSLARQLVREGLSALASTDRVTVRLGDFYRMVVEDVRQSVAQLSMEVIVNIDPALPAHSCLIESQWGRVDESVETRLRVLLDQLDASRMRSNTNE